MVQDDIFYYSALNDPNRIIVNDFYIKLLVSINDDNY